MFTNSNIQLSHTFTIIGLIADNCSPFQPIFAAINTPNYKLAKFLVPILKSLTSNEYKVNDSLLLLRKLLNKILNYLWEA